MPNDLARKFTILRAIDSKYEESNDSSENSVLLLVNYFQEYTLKVPANSDFFEI